MCRPGAVLLIFGKTTCPSCGSPQVLMEEGIGPRRHGGHGEEMGTQGWKPRKTPKTRKERLRNRGGRAGQINRYLPPLLCLSCLSWFLSSFSLLSVSCVPPWCLPSPHRASRHDNNEGSVNPTGRPPARAGFRKFRQSVAQKPPLRTSSVLRPSSPGSALAASHLLIKCSNTAISRAS
jgi:hypothetical protein